MTDFFADKLRQECGSRVLHDKVHEEARERHQNDATQSGYDHHVVRVAAEHGARLAILAMAEREKRMRETGMQLAFAAGALNIATDSDEHLRGERVSVLDALKLWKSALGEEKA